MRIQLTPEQYTHMSLNATVGASKRITAACTPGVDGEILFTVGDDVLTVLQAINRADLADAAARARWSTMRGGVLYAAPPG